MSKQGEIRLEIDQFDSLEKSKSELAACEKEQDTGEEGMYHTSSGKKQGVAVSQEVQGHLGLINIQTVRVTDEHPQQQTIVESHHHHTHERVLSFDQHEQEQEEDFNKQKNATPNTDSVNYSKKPSTTARQQQRNQPPS